MKTRQCMQDGRNMVKLRFDKEDKGIFSRVIYIGRKGVFIFSLVLCDDIFFLLDNVME